MSHFERTPRTTLRRRPQRGSHDRATVEAILDEAFLCHLATRVGDQVWCIPLVYARMGDAIYLHGSSANRVLGALRDGAPACAVVTLVDGLVLARSAFHSSVNYRSVVIYGTARTVTDADEKDRALRAIVEAAIPQRSPDVRAPSEAEIRRTLVLRLPLCEVSAKLRSGPPVDDDADYARSCWAGIIPLAMSAGEPIDDPRLASGIPAPDYARHYRRPTRALPTGEEHVPFPHRCT